MKTKRRLLIAGIVVGSILTFSPIIGIIGTVMGVIHSFQQLAASSVGDPQEASAAIGETLVSIIAGVLVGAVGMVLLFVSAVKLYRMRDQAPPLPQTSS